MIDYKKLHNHLLVLLLIVYCEYYYVSTSMVNDLLTDPTSKITQVWGGHFGLQTPGNNTLSFSVPNLNPDKPMRIIVIILIPTTKEF